ncbi:hypothetical protein PVAP13_8KG375800 [Panicum virgatum]|uniref:Uncharacterized protein n=1 Tax=Panicum virgatum TaxID=38727 RepID=A0A8T0PNL5_PANVG|nr:hypothetical protein PVAP13_8KG375800 [Panicum virgatum]
MSRPLWRPQHVRRIASPPHRSSSSLALRRRVRGQGPGSWHNDSKRALLDPNTKVAGGAQLAGAWDGGSPQRSSYLCPVVSKQH